MFLLQTERYIFDYLYSHPGFVSERLVIQLFTRSKVRVVSLLEIYRNKGLIESKMDGEIKVCRLTEKGRRVVNLAKEFDKLVYGKD